MINKHQVNGKEWNSKTNFKVKEINKKWRVLTIIVKITYNKIFSRLYSTMNLMKMQATTDKNKMTKKNRKEKKVNTMMK